jgi:hypothetical protein
LATTTISSKWDYRPSGGRGIIAIRQTLAKLKAGDKNIKIKINSVASNFATAEIAVG